MKYCSRCVYPAVAATPLTFDANGVCTGCRASDQRKAIDWAPRREQLRTLLEQYRTKGANYDCIIPVSGGKDSYYQAHVVITELGLKPLLVTYHGNNYLPVGERNLFRMREVFDCDHIVFRPSVKTLVRLNRICFRKMGDMNWHAHCGILHISRASRIQAFRVPLLIWGEHGYTDLAGMYF